MPRARSYTYNGTVYSLAELADLVGLSPAGMYARLRYYGYSVDTAVERARSKRGAPPRVYTHAGRTLTLLEWSRVVGIADKTLADRLRAGWSIEQAVSIPSKAQRRRGIVVNVIPDAETPSTDHQTPGVPSDLGPFVGTGAGSTARETPNITFPEKAEA